MKCHGTKTAALLVGMILGFALWTPALPWLLKSVGIADTIQQYSRMLTLASR
jgi:hypothetical protein